MHLKSSSEELKMHMPYNICVQQTRLPERRAWKWHWDILNEVYFHFVLKVPRETNKMNTGVSIISHIPESNIPSNMSIWLKAIVPASWQVSQISDSCMSSPGGSSFLLKSADKTYLGWLTPYIKLGWPCPALPCLALPCFFLPLY